MDAFIRRGIRAFCATQRLPAPLEGHYLRVAEEEARTIARYYDALPCLSEQAKASYIAFGQEVDVQYAWATDVLGITFEASSADSYQSSAEMMADVSRAKRLRVYANELSHPFLTDEQNWRFRGVHDLFGHAAEGYQFGPRGEHNAWIHHSMMFSPTAQAALTTETRGQNSWFNFGPYAGLPVRQRPFAQQKCALLPSWVWDWRTGIELG